MGGDRPASQNNFDTSDVYAIITSMSHLRPKLRATVTAFASSLMIATMVAGGASAANPPKNTGNATPPAWTPPAAEGFDDREVTPDPHAAADTMTLNQLSGTMRGSSLPPRRGHLNRASSSTVPLAGSARFRVRADNVPFGSLNPIYTHDVSVAGPDVEPATISNNIGGTTYHVGAYAHWTGTAYVGEVVTATALSSSGYSPLQRTTLYMPAGYTDFGDAWLSESVFDDGVAPRRIYVTGIVFNRDAAGNGVSPSSIRTWYSNNGGQTWSGGWPIDERAASQGVVDKPATDVSAYSGTRGHFYVAYTDFGTPQRLLLRRNSNGVTPFCNAVAPIRCYSPGFTEAVITDQNNPIGAQVVVNPTNGHVYVLWQAQTATGSQIRMRRSIDGSVTGFEAGEIVVANNFVSPRTVANGMRSTTLPHARFNAVTNQVMVTWHGSDSSSNGNAVYYTAFDPDTVQPWSSTPSRVRIDAAGEQFQPAVDNDDYGNPLITYYSTQNDGGGRYQPFGVYLSTGGGVLTGPSPLHSQLNDNRWPAGNPVFIGDYHDNFYWSGFDADGSRWNTSWTPFLSSVQELDTHITGVK